MTAIRDTFHPLPPTPSVEEILRNIAEGQARRRAELGLPPVLAVAAPKEMTGQIVETVERLGPSGRPWGFVFLRVTYGDDARWAAFKSRFMELLQQSVDPELEVGWERIKDDLSIEMIEDVALDHAGLPESLKYVSIHGSSRCYLGVLTKYSRYFQGVQERGGIAAGLDLQVFLVVNEECVNSVLNAEGDGVPFVLAQDVEYGQQEEEQNEESYPGVFKVSIDALLSSLYVGLQGMSMAPEELWPFADPIFEGTDFF
jgi:hypothetical protein